jgi:hypothetical protein
VGQASAAGEGTTSAGLGGGRVEAQQVRQNPEGEAGSPSVIVARMNRRQVNELSAALSKQQGQHAELKTFAPAVAEAIKEEAIKQVTQGVPASANGSAAGKGVDGVLDADALTLGVDVRGGAKAAPATGPVDSALREQVGDLKAKAEKEPKSPLRYYGATSPSSSPAAASAAAPANPAVPAPSEAFRLTTDPQDEPVDVVIVVKKEAAPTTAPKPQIDGAP